MVDQSMNISLSWWPAVAVSLAAVLAIQGCNATLPALPGINGKEGAPANPGERPDWIDNPGGGVSASAGTHIRGKVAQEALAIQRAREEYAKRFGVTIASEQITAQNFANGRANSVGAKVMREETKQSEVKARIKSKWRDPASDTLWVWLVPGEN